MEGFDPYDFFLKTQQGTFTEVLAIFCSYTILSREHLAFTQFSRNRSLHLNTKHFTERVAVHENSIVHALIHSHFTLP